MWWLRQYAGGLFLPLRDGTAGESSYGGGWYALDTAKGAGLGGRAGRLIIDLNFLYHPSCRYDDAWVCLLAPPGNAVSTRVSAGERLSSARLRSTLRAASPAEAVLTRPFWAWSPAR